MTTELATQTEQIEEGLWRWSVWIETNSSEDIEEAVYTLDSSFFNPVRRTKESGSNFKITDLAFGSFTIFAKIKFGSGTELKLEKRLHLENAYAAGSRPSVKPIILAVDDDVSVLEALTQDLRRQYGVSFRNVRASSGKQALEILQKAKSDGEDVALILSDQRMPEMQGTEFLSLATQYFPSAKLALLTAFADTEVLISAINVCRVDYYLQKPWDPPEEKLYPAIDELLSVWQPIRGVQLHGR